MILNKNTIRYIIFILSLMIGKGAFAALPSITLNLTVTSHETCTQNGSLNWTVNGQTAGSDIIYTIYKNTDLVNAIATTSVNGYSGLPAGIYRVVATQTFNGESNSTYKQVTINNTFKELAYTVSSVSEICNSDGKITVTRTAGIVATTNAYALTAGPVTRPPQTSNVFTDLPAGTYTVSVTDACGNIKISSGYVVQSTPSKFSFNGIYPSSGSTELIYCDSINLVATLKYDTGYTIKAPLTYTYTVHPPDGSTDIILTGTRTTTTVINVNIPFYNNNLYTVDLEITDACGYKISGVYNPKSSSTKAIYEATLTQSNTSASSPCTGSMKYISSRLNFWKGPYTIEFVKAPEGFVPSDYNTLYPGPYTSSSVTFGSYTQAVPEGTYSIKFTDACGREATKSIVVKYDAVAFSLLLQSRPDACNFDKNYITVSHNSPLTSLQVTAYTGVTPFPYPLPYEVPVASDGKPRLTAVPRGRYTFSAMDSCGNKTTQIFSMKDVSLGTATVNVKENCSNFDLDISLTNSTKLPADESTGSSSYMGRQYVLQKYYSGSGWGHPSTGKIQKSGDLLGSENSLSLNGPSVDGTSTISNLTFTGYFRVVRYNNHSFIHTPGEPNEADWVVTTAQCPEIIKEFTYEQNLSVTHAYGFKCPGGTTTDVGILAQGRGSLSYRIIKKDGINYSRDNGTSNLFLGLAEGIYTFEVEDGCGNVINVVYDVTKLSFPRIKPFLLCDGDNGSLSVEGVPYLSFKWWKEEAEDIILSTSSKLEFSPFNAATDKGKYYVHLTSPSGSSCVNHVLEFEIGENVSNPNAGDDITAGVPGSQTSVNLFDYISADADTYGEFTVITTTAAGYLVGSIFSPESLPMGSYQFKYTVNGLCQGKDEAIITLVIKNYWHGTIDNRWIDTSNWTAKYIPQTGEDIEFATAANNSNNPAQKDLYLDKDRIIGNLINNSDVNLVVTTQNQLIINGTVRDDNANKGTIVVKSDPDKATGTLIFTNPENNTAVNAIVEFYNKAYECATCGFYRKQWQYFGIPVQLSYFPYLSPQVETVNQWVEPYIYSNKWRPAPYTPDLTLKAFKGYEMTNSNNAEPTHIYSFPGILNVGDATVGVTKTANVDYSGMNLLSNSFTAAIPITSAAIALGSVELKSNTVYLFNMGTRDQWRKLNGGSAYGVAAGQYQAVPFNLAGQAGIPDRILSMHTFMLDVITPGNITLKYDQLLKNELNASTVKPWKSAELRSSTIQLPHIVMDVISNGSADRVWLFEEADATTEFDNGWDGYKMKEGDLIQTYVLGSDQSDYQIATVPEIIGTTIGVSSGLNENYSINFSVTPDVESRNLFLRDLFTWRNYSIKNNAEYVINGTNNSNNNRFKIVASSSSLIDEDIISSPINIYVRNNIIIVDNQSEEDCSVMVYDLMGRLVANKQAPKSQITEFINISQNKTGVYIVKVLGESNSINKTDRVLLR